MNGFLVLGPPKQCKFLQIEDYYPSINETVFNSALLFAKRKGLLTMQNIEIIKFARISFLDYDGKLWIRSGTREGFEIAIGSSDSAQATDLVDFT